MARDTTTPSGTTNPEGDPAPVLAVVQDGKTDDTSGPVKGEANATSGEANPEPTVPSDGSTPATVATKEGETLVQWCVRVLGHAGNFVNVLTWNQDRIDDPNAIPVGTELRTAPEDALPR